MCVAVVLLRCCASVDGVMVVMINVILVVKDDGSMSRNDRSPWQQQQRGYERESWEQLKMETKRTARQSRLPAPAGGTVSRRTASSTTESKGTAGKTAPKSTSGGASQGSASSSMWGKTGSVSFPELKRQHAALAEEHEKLVEKHQKLKEHARKESRKSTKRVEQLEVGCWL